MTETKALSTEHRIEIAAGIIFTVITCYTQPCLRLDGAGGDARGVSCAGRLRAWALPDAANLVKYKDIAGW